MRDVKQKIIKSLLVVEGQKKLCDILGAIDMAFDLYEKELLTKVKELKQNIEDEYFTEEDKEIEALLIKIYGDARTPEYMKERRSGNNLAIDKVVELIDPTERKIIVNAKEKSWFKPFITYRGLVGLAEMEHTELLYTVTFAKCKGRHLPENGILTEEDGVEVNDGMIFNVSLTNNA